MFKGFKGFFKKTGEKPLYEKLDELLDESDRVIYIFISIVENLKKTNEELGVIAGESQDIANRHIGLANNALEKIKTNLKKIKKIEDIVN